MYKHHRELLFIQVLGVTKQHSDLPTLLKAYLAYGIVHVAQCTATVRSIQIELSQVTARRCTAIALGQRPYITSPNKKIYKNLNEQKKRETQPEPNLYNTGNTRKEITVHPGKQYTLNKAAENTMNRESCPP